MKYCLITGGSGFLGSEIVKSYLRESYTPIVLDKNKLKIKNKKIIFFKCDITSEKQVKSVFNKIKQKKISINTIVNNAAIDAVPSINKKRRFPTVNEWRKEIDVSIIGSYLIIKYFSKNMLKQKEGSIINIGSDLSVIAPNQILYKKIFNNYLKPPTYSVVKFGLNGLTKYYASLYADSNIKVNMVSPGPIENNQKKNFLKELKKYIPMKKLAKMSDITNMILYLSSNKNNFITGQNIIIDGGRTII